MHASRIPKRISITILAVHLCLLGWGAKVHSPTADEPSHLVAGLSHWELGRFGLYRVNPPLIRAVAALPVYFARPVTDWDSYSVKPGSRPEWRTSSTFIFLNGSRSFWYITLARWACIPFSLMGGYVCYRWSRDLYGAAAGVVALTLWCFCPNIVGHGQLLTPDVGATALCVLACYAFWHWLRLPSWKQAVFAGLALGLTELTKTTLLILYPLWPLLWLAWRAGARWRDPGKGREAAQLGLALFIGLVVLNGGYGFEGTLKPLGDYRFISKKLAGTQDRQWVESNRFSKSWLAYIPVPLPENYVLGIDTQSRDFERTSRSYLRGEWRERGWWYYYIYALAIKVPLGTCLLFILAIALPLFKRAYSIAWRDELMVWAPLVVVLFFVSSHVGFNRHLRYVLPIFPFVFIIISRLAFSFQLHHRVISVLLAVALFWSVFHSMSVYPHSLSYFNEAIGGPEEGKEHLLDSNLDWGQDLLFLKQWYDDHPEARPLRMAYWGPVDPRILGITFALPPQWAAQQPNDDKQAPTTNGPYPGWYAISVNILQGYFFWIPDGLGQTVKLEAPLFTYFQKFHPTAYAGRSIYIYHVNLDEANRVRGEFGLPLLKE